MKTLKSELVQQIVSYSEVGTELRNRIDALNNLGCSIKNVIETSVNNVHNKQGFIVVYEINVSDDEVLLDEFERTVKEIYASRSQSGKIMDEFGTDNKIKHTSTTHIIPHVDEPDMFECCRCGVDLKESTKYCPHCGRYNIDFKEEN